MHSIDRAHAFDRIEFGESIECVADRVRVYAPPPGSRSLVACRSIESIRYEIDRPIESIVHVATAFIDDRRRIDMARGDDDGGGGGRRPPSSREDEWDLLEQSMAPGAGAGGGQRAKAANANDDAGGVTKKRARVDAVDDGNAYGELSPGRGGGNDDGGDDRRRGRHGSRGRRRSSRSASRDYDRRGGGRRGGRRSRSGDRQRLSTPEREEERARKKKEREEERQRRELDKLDRDTRTVFVVNLSTKLDERGIFQFFSKVGTVTDVRIIYDRNTPKSKGMAYVEFADKKDIHAALELTGQMLHGQSITVKMSEAEKNIAWEAEQAQKKRLGQTYGQGVPYIGSSGPCKLRVGGLHLGLSEEDVRAVFEPFGELDFISMNKEDVAAGAFASAFVQYKETAHAMLALSQLNGLELVGIPIRVSIASQGAQAAASTMAAPVESLGELDEGGQGLKLDSRSRAALMARLAGQDTEVNKAFTIDPQTGLPTTVDTIKPLDAPGEALPLAAQPITQGVLGPGSPIPTPCLLLKNLFDPKEETEPEWWLDIAEDVKGECSKFGAITHAYVDKESQGFVYLRFVDVPSSTRAQQALHARWFAGRKIAAEYQFEATYIGHFGL